MKEFSIEKKYIYLALIFGVLMVFLIPPFQSPDENSHFKKAYLVSTGHPFPEVVNNEIGNYLPRVMVEYINSTDQHMSKLSWKYTYQDLLYSEIQGLDTNDRVFQSYSTIGTNPLAYVFAASGIVFGNLFAKLFTNGAKSITYMLYFARIFNLIAYSVIIYFAIKKTPVLKRTMATVALIPMGLFMTSMVSYDGIVISLCLLLIANLLNDVLNDSAKITKKSIALYSIIFFILFTVKMVYCTLFIMLLFIPKKKYENYKTGIIKLVEIVGIGLALSFMIKLPMSLLKYNSTSSSAPHDQIMFILHNPIEFLKIMYHTIVGGKFFYSNTTLGTLGLLDTYLPAPILVFVFVNLFVISIAEGSKDKEKINWIMKLCNIGAVILSVIAIFAALYVSWTSTMKDLGVGAKSISGVQGRYFLPLILPCLMIFSNKFIYKKNKIKKACDVVADNWSLVPFICLMITVFTTATRFWI